MNFDQAYKKVKAGSLLIAAPYSDDSYFKRSVILITEHSNKGDVGFILNKNLTLNLYDLVEEFPKTDFTLCLGGPVHPSTLHYIHNLGDILIPKAMHICDNLYWGGDFSIIRQLVESGEIAPECIKFFLGYCGWESGQLRKEFINGDWGVVNSCNMELISDSTNLWYDAVEQSEEYSHWGVIPENPEDN